MAVRAACRRGGRLGRRAVLGLLVRAAPTPALSWIVSLRPASASAAPLTRLSTAELGCLGEEIASRHLRRQGFRLVGRNVDAAEAELDIIAVEAGALVVIEVKAGWCPAHSGRARLESPEWGHKRPALRVTKTGVRRRLRAARRLAASQGLSQGRVDVIEVIAGRGVAAELVHYQGVTPEMLPEADKRRRTLKNDHK